MKVCDDFYKSNGESPTFLEDIREEFTQPFI